MGLQLVVEVMNPIGTNSIPAGVRRSAGSRIDSTGVALVRIIGLEDESILLCHLPSEDTSHHESLGRRIATNCTVHTAAGSCITEDCIAIRLFSSVGPVEGC